MKQLILSIFVLLGSIIMLWFSLSFLIVGRSLYGSDASLLFAAGFLFFIAINSLTNLFLKLNKEVKQ